MASSQIFGQMVVVSLVKNSKSRNSEVPKHDIQDHYIAVLGDITATAPVELPSRWNPPRATLFAKPGQARSFESEYRGRWISSLSSKSCSTSQRRRPRRCPAMTKSTRRQHEGTGVTFSQKSHQVRQAASACKHFTASVTYYSDHVCRFLDSSGHVCRFLNGMAPNFGMS